MPALQMSLEEVLAELRQDADFAAFPDWWQQTIAEHVLENGLESTLEANAAWASSNPGDPNSAALTRWAQRGQQVVSAPPGTPIEQGILQTVLPGLINQITGDQGRQGQVTNWTNQTNAAFGNLAGVLGNAAMTFNGAEYLRQNPDVAAAYASDGAGMNVDDYAKRHYETYGRSEGRAPVFTSDVNRSQIGALNAATSTMTNAAAVAAAAKTGALGQLTAAQLTNLDQSLATQRAALTQEVQQLQGNASAAAAARRAALEQQIIELTAAQAPVSDARLRAAETEATGINIGLEGTRDQLRADAAREGFIGGSTMQDAALARAAIGARQDSARTMGGARVMNATDTRNIGNFGAGQRYSITDVLAGEMQRVGNYGATGQATLTGRGAEIGRGIRDTGAQGQFSISGALADQNQSLTNANAAARVAYNDQLFPQAVNSAQLLTQLPGANASANAALIPYGTAGTNNALNTLNWWATNNGTPPTTTAVTTAPSTMGNSVAGLGAGLVGSAFQLGQANQWWRPQQPPVTVPPANQGNSSGANLYTFNPGRI